MTSENDKQLLRKLIEENEFFNAFFNLNTSDFNKFKTTTLMEISRVRKFKNGFKIVDEEKQNINFFIIIKGEIEIYQRKKLIDKLSDAAYFGEECLFNSGCSYTAIAKDEVCCMEFPKNVLRKMHSVVKGRKKLQEEDVKEFSLGKCMAAMESNYAMRTFEKQNIASFIKESIEKQKVFSLSHWDTESLLIGMERIPINAGFVLAEQGKTLEGLFVVEEGVFDEIKLERGIPKCVRKGGKGECIGISSLLQKTFSESTIKFKEDGCVFKIMRPIFRVLNRIQTVSDEDALTFFSDLKKKISFVEWQIFKRYILFKESIKSLRFSYENDFIIFPLKDRIIKTEKNEYKITKGATIKYTKELHEVLKNHLDMNFPFYLVSKPDIEDIFGSDKRLAEVFSFDQTLNEVIPQKTKEIILKEKNEDLSKGRKMKFIELKKLRKMKQIGYGSFGNIYCVVDEDSDTNFAIKEIDKRKLSKEIHEKKIKWEVDSLRKVINKDFIIKIFESFNTKNYLYILTEIIPGGDLYCYMKKGKILTEDHARFYIAAITEAIDMIHSLNVIHRDLKPENVMVDNSGYIKIIDFGFSKKLSLTEKTYTLCGTPDFIAPEVFLGYGHGRTADWWSLGVIMYEMLIGKTPYEDMKVLEKFKKIYEGDLKFEKDISEDAKDVIKGFLCKNPLRRLGVNGAEEIRNCRWFEGFDWDALRKRTMEAPVKPMSGSLYSIGEEEADQSQKFEPEIYCEKWSEHF